MELLGIAPSFGQMLFEFGTDSGWPLSIVWSYDGGQLAYCTQGGCVMLLSGFSSNPDGQLIVKVLQILHNSVQAFEWVFSWIKTPVQTSEVDCEKHFLFVYQDACEIHTSKLPFTSLLFCSSTSIIGAGYDNHPVILYLSGKGVWMVQRHPDGKTSLFIETKK